MVDMKKDMILIIALLDRNAPALPEIDTDDLPTDAMEETTHDKTTVVVVVHTLLHVVTVVVLHVRSPVDTRLLLALLPDGNTMIVVAMTIRGRLPLNMGTVVVDLLLLPLTLRMSILQVEAVTTEGSELPPRLIPPMWLLLSFIPLVWPVILQRWPNTTPKELLMTNEVTRVIRIV